MGREDRRQREYAKRLNNPLPIKQVMSSPFNEKQTEFYDRFINECLPELVFNFKYFMQNEFSHAMFHEPGMFLVTRINPDFSPYRFPDPKENNIIGDVHLAEYENGAELRCLVDQMYYKHGLEKIIVFGEKTSQIEELADAVRFTRINAYYDPSDGCRHLKLEIKDELANKKPC